MTNITAAKRNRAGFSLIELVVVVLIMGILAAVAAPRMFDKMSDAKDSSSRQSLAVIRGAIDNYKLENDKYPETPVDLAKDLKPYLKGEFPKCEVIDGNNEVAESTAKPIVPDSSKTASWLYNKTTGDIGINHADYQAW